MARASVFRRLPFAVRPEVLLAFLLFGATWALFGPATGFDYLHLDDPQYVVDNPIVAGGLRGEGVRQAFATVHAQWWLPLLWISYMVDAALFGPGPQGHHLANVLLHAANAALLFWFLFRTTGSRGRSFFVAALFAWHPTRVEAVAWIAARKDVLSGLFFMLLLLAHARHAEKPSAGRLGLVFLLLLAGLMSKAVLVAAPFVLLALDFWPLRRASAAPGASPWATWKPLVREKLPLFALAAAFAALNLRTHVTGTGVHAGVPWTTRLGLIPPNVFAYLAKLAAPLRLNVIYPEHDVASWPLSLAAALALAGALVFFFRQRARRPHLLVGGLWFLLPLAPVVRGVRLGLAQYADRFSYLPLIGLGIALAWTAADWAGAAPRRRGLILAAGGLALAACLARTPAQLRWWRDSLALFGRAAHLAPGHPVVQASYGLELLAAGQTATGEAHLREAVRLAPRDADFLSNWGTALLELGRAEEALAAQDRALALNPGAARFHNNRAIALERLGRRDEAQAAFLEALRLRPAYAEAHFSFGNFLYAEGRTAEALRHYEAATAARPDQARNWLNRGLALAKLGRHAEALACVERALVLDPQIPHGAAACEKLRARVR